MVAIYITVFFIVANALLTVAGTVVEIQVRTHGDAERALQAVTESTEDLLKRRQNQRHEAIERQTLTNLRPLTLSNFDRKERTNLDQAELNIPADEYDISIRL